jgi:hypothetical protein
VEVQVEEERCRETGDGRREPGGWAIPARHQRRGVRPRRCPRPLSTPSQHHRHHTYARRSAHNAYASTDLSKADGFTQYTGTPSPELSLLLLDKRAKFHGKFEPHFN